MAFPLQDNAYVKQAAAALTQTRQSEPALVALLVLSDAQNVRARDQSAAILKDIAAYQDSSGELADVAAAAAQRAPPWLEQHLRRLLSRAGAACRLPQPRVLGVVPSMPVTASGKVNRQLIKALCQRLLQACLSEQQPQPSQTLASSVHCQAPDSRATQHGADVDGASATADQMEAARAEEAIARPGAKRARNGASEAGVTQACISVLLPLLQARGRPLEPSDDLLALGATSMHAAAIAALLDTQPEQVYRYPTCRALARALQASRTAGSYVAAVNAEEAARKKVQRTQCTQRSTTLTADRHEPPWPAGGQAQLSSLPQVQCAQPPPCRAERALLRASDSRGESLAAVVAWSDLPRTSARQRTPAQYPIQARLPRAADGAAQPSGAGMAEGEVSVVVRMDACVDAPVTVLEYSCHHHKSGRRPARRECSCAPRVFVLACSHAGDVACVDAHSEARSWVARVAGAPDVGGQVDASGTSFAVATHDGGIRVLRLADGALMCSVHSGGQLRRCDACRAGCDHILHQC
jgi:hypothetical protein